MFFKVNHNKKKNPLEPTFSRRSDFAVRQISWFQLSPTGDRPSLLLTVCARLHTRGYFPKVYLLQHLRLSLTPTPRSCADNS